MVRAIDEGLGLRAGEPVPCPDALLFDAGDLVDAGGGFGLEPAVGGGLARQFLNAARRWLIVEGAYPLDSSAARWAWTAARVKGGVPCSARQAKKSSSALPYMARVEGLETASRTRRLTASSGTTAG